MITIARGGALTLCCLFACLSHAEDGRAAHGICSNATLQGAYNFRAEGSVLATSGLPVALHGPFASLGTATYDGAGNVTLSAFASFNGVIQPVTVSGSYQVDSDCTFTSQLANGVTFYAAIADRGDTLFVQQTTPGTVVSGTAQRLRPVRGERRQEAQHCEHADIARRYGFIATGFGAAPYAPPPLSGPQSGTGLVRFDARGGFVISALSSTNGVIDAMPQQLTGSYTLGRDCLLSMKADVGLNFTGRVLDGGREVQVVETDPGATVLVRARAID